MHEYRLNEESLGGCLMRDQVVSDHLLGEVPDLLGGLAYLHAALETTRQLALATAARLDLRLQDEAALVRETGGYLRRVRLVQSKRTLLDVHSVLAHDEFGLELVQIEESTLVLSHHHWLLSHASPEHVLCEHGRYHILLFKFI